MAGHRRRSGRRSSGASKLMKYIREMERISRRRRPRRHYRRRSDFVNRSLI